MQPTDRTSQLPFIDVNTHVFAWPFRHSRYSSPKSLARYLRDHGIQHAWVGSFEAVLHRDIDGVNRRLAVACQSMPGCQPFGTVHLGLATWKEDLNRCFDEYRMPGIRLYPGYHQYHLSDRRVADLLRQCGARRRLVQIVLSLEDARTQHPLVQVPPVDPAPIAGLAAQNAELPIVLLNAFREQRMAVLSELTQQPNVYLELSTLEGVAGLERTLNLVPASQILFGSQTPYYYPLAAILKLKEANIGAAQRQAIASENARRILRYVRTQETPGPP